MSSRRVRTCSGTQRRARRCPGQRAVAACGSLPACGFQPERYMRIDLWEAQDAACVNYLWSDKIAGCSGWRHVGNVGSADALVRLSAEAMRAYSGYDRWYRQNHGLSLSLTDYAGNGQAFTIDPNFATIAGVRRTAVPENGRVRIELCAIFDYWLRPYLAEWDPQPCVSPPPGGGDCIHRCVHGSGYWVDANGACHPYAPPCTPPCSFSGDYGVCDADQIYVSYPAADWEGHNRPGQVFEVPPGMTEDEALAAAAVWGIGTLKLTFSCEVAPVDAANAKFNAMTAGKSGWVAFFQTTPTWNQQTKFEVVGPDIEWAGWSFECLWERHRVWIQPGTYVGWMSTAAPHFNSPANEPVYDLRGTTKTECEDAISSIGALAVRRITRMKLP